MAKSSYPSLQVLQQFTQISRSQGLAAAARRLRMSQPALSKNVKRLEDLVGTELLDRHKRGTELTAAGEAFLRHAERAVVEYEYAVEEARKAAGISAQELRIGVGVVFASTLIPRAIPEMQAMAPNARISIKTIPYADIRDELMARRIDIAAHGLPGDDGPGLVTLPLFTGERTVICHESHPLTKLPGPVPLSQIADYPFVTFSTDMLEMRKLAAVFYDHGLSPPQSTVETDTINGALKMLRHGRHLFFGSSMLVHLEAEPGLTRVPVEASLGTYELGISHLESYSMESATKALVGILGRILKEAASA